MSLPEELSKAASIGVGIGRSVGISVGLGVGISVGLGVGDRRSVGLGVGIGIGVGLAVAVFSAGAQAADEFPRRKAGLWEMKTSGGSVGPRTIQQCIDATTDDLLRVRSNEGQNCAPPVVERDGSRYKVQSNCDSNGVKSTVHGDYTMTGDNQYTGDMKMTFDPPMSGVSEMNMKMEGKWLGACKPGMKPGDIVMQGMPKLNMLDLDQKPQGKPPSRRQGQPQAAPPAPAAEPRAEPPAAPSVTPSATP